MESASYPKEFDAPIGCEVCFRLLDECDCLECPKCSEVGRMECQVEHGLIPVRPECAHDAIRSLQDLAVLVSANQDTEASIGHRLFKDTECGIVFSSRGFVGVVVAGYAEGSDTCIDGHEVDYPFTAETFWSAVSIADEEGCEVWDEWNTLDTSGFVVGAVQTERQST